MLSILCDIENLIRAGQIRGAIERLNSIVISDLPRSQWATMANLFWRTGQGQEGVRLLKKIVREENGRSPPSIIELAEYSKCLNSIGCSIEALELVQNKGDAPSLKQAHAFALISQWRYEAALPLLKDLTSHQSEDPYPHLVNSVNLMACLNFMGLWDEASSGIEALLTSGHPELSPRLKINLMELKLQVFLGQGDFKSARRLMDSLNLSNIEGVEQFFLEKWATVLAVCESPNEEAKEALFALRLKAVELQKWESVREIDFYMARFFQNDTFFYRVYFATPYEGFRERILKLYPKPIRLPPHFHFRLLPQEHGVISRGEREGPIDFSLDAHEGRIGDSKLKIGNLEHRLLTLLSSDLYRPFSVGGVFQRLFPEEYYNPFVSPNRVHQAVKSLREALVETPLLVDEIQGQYRISTKSLIDVVLVRSWVGPSKVQLRLESVKFKWPQEFTAKDVMAELNCSLKTAQRLIKEGLDQGICEKWGQGASTFYRWKSESIESEEDVENLEIVDLNDEE